MRTLVKDSIKLLTEQHVNSLLEAMKSTGLTDGEHVAIAVHGMGLQLTEVAAALNRIYQAMETAKLNKNA